MLSSRVAGWLVTAIAAELLALVLSVIAGVSAPSSAYAVGARGRDVPAARCAPAATADGHQHRSGHGGGERVRRRCHGPGAGHPIAAAPGHLPGGLGRGAGHRGRPGAAAAPLPQHPVVDRRRPSAGRVVPVHLGHHQQRAAGDLHARRRRGRDAHRLDRAALEPGAVQLGHLRRGTHRGTRPEPGAITIAADHASIRDLLLLARCRGGDRRSARCAVSRHRPSSAASRCSARSATTSPATPRPDRWWS